LLSANMSILSDLAVLIVVSSFLLASTTVY